VDKFPDADAVKAIEAAIHAATRRGLRGELVEAAGKIPGTLPLALLKTNLAPGSGLDSHVHAAVALSARGEAGVMPAMIQAWKAVQPRLPLNDADAYFEVGGLIMFLTKSNDAAAIDALRERMEGAPIDVRLAVVEVFLPSTKSGGGLFATGRVCDMAALVLSERWPEKYQFRWVVDTAECDTQIAVIRKNAGPLRR